jgi:pimeloyl-ACP methyl ester carboxylesterase
MCVDSADVVGHSLGGGYAILLALHNPARVRRLVLAAPAAGPYVSLRIRLLSLRLAALAPAIRRPRLDREFRLFVNRGEAIEEEELDEIARTLDRPGVQRWFLAVARLTLRLRGIRPGYLLLDRLSSLHKPALVVWGRHDRVLPFRNAQLVARELPEARLEVLENSGHMVIYEEAEAFNRLLLGFLDGDLGAAVAAADSAAEDDRHDARRVGRNGAGHRSRDGDARGREGAGWVRDHDEGAAIGH